MCTPMAKKTTTTHIDVETYQLSNKDKPSIDRSDRLIHRIQNQNGFKIHIFTLSARLSGIFIMHQVYVCVYHQPI